MIKKKIALVLGVTGQDGSYISEFLIKKNYYVHGMIRKSSTSNTRNIDHLINNMSIYNKLFFLHRGDLLDYISISKIINEVKPDEIYNFADQDHVGWSFDVPLYSWNTTASSVIQILELLRKNKKRIKFFQPASSNMFGLTKNKKIDENTILAPGSLYALGKASSFLAVKMYVKMYKIFGCGAIFFNHESPRRSEEYVTRKIVKNACDIYLGKKKFIELGDINIKIDWGYAKDYVEAAWKIMQLKDPDFFIIATGRTNSVRVFAEKTFSYLGLNFYKYLKINKKLLRPVITKSLNANTSKAFKRFKFKNKVSLDSLIKIMVDSELKKYEL
jgi:GDPmannose 4,6-dehydratase